MVSKLVSSLWENKERLHLMDVALNSNLLDYNFVGSTSINSVLKFIEDHPVDVIDIKTPNHIYSIEVKDLESFTDEAVYYTITLKGGKEICLL